MEGIRSRTNRPTNQKASYDGLLIAVYLIMVTMGWFSIYSVDYNETDTIFFSIKQTYGKQLLWISISLIIGFIILLLDPKIIPAFSFLFYGIIILLLASVFTIGKATNAALSWIEIGSFKLQPSEFAKLATSLCLARYLDTFEVSFKKTRDKIISFIIFLLPMGLVLMQNDTGSALVFAAFGLVLYREGLPLWIILLIVAAAILFVLSILVEPIILLGILAGLCLVAMIITRKVRSLMWVILLVGIGFMVYTYSCTLILNSVLKPYQKERIYITLGLKEDNKGAGYNVYHSKLAIGSGGITGKGYLQGTHTRLNYVPEQNTDFIFCAVGEEWGFIGTSATVLLFLTLLWRIVVIAERQKSRFSRLYAYCVACIFFMHFLINIGMTIGLFPVIGIPLPFYSYGGSSMLSFSTLLFILIRLDANRVNEIGRSIDD